MNIKSMLQELKFERDRIEKAIEALEALDRTTSVPSGAKQRSPVNAKKSGRKIMSAAARKRIAEAQKKRWAATKAAAKKTTA